MDETHPALLRSGKSPFLRRYNRDYLIGVGLLLVVVFLWTSSNFLTQGLFDGGYEKPFLVTYLCTSSFALYLVPYALRSVFQPASLRGGETPTADGYQPLRNEPVLNEVLTPVPLIAHDAAHRSVNGDLAPLTIRETAKLAAWFCFLWFAANWSLNASLDYTSVASATILSSMSGFFTLGIGRAFRVETLTLVKIGAVVTSFGGVILVSLSDSSQQEQRSLVLSRAQTGYQFVVRTLGISHIVGDTLALLSALFYALYVTLLKVHIRSESRIDMQLFFGFVGLFNILAMWPVGVLLHFAGVERFQLPTGSSTVVALLINMAITLSSDYIYVIAMLKTTPLVVTIGLSLTMPLAVLGDFMLKKQVKIQVILGAIIVLLSFIAVGLEDSRNEEESDFISGRRLDEEGDATVRLEEEVPLDPRS